jgi:hypothetical protein
MFADFAFLPQWKIDSARAHWISIIPADENEPTIHHDVGEHSTQNWLFSCLLL